MSDFQQIDVNQLQQMLQQHDICLVDVRTEQEVAQGVIANPVTIPLQQIPMRITELDKNKTTVFYCKMGVRSAQAAGFAVDQGFADVYNLQGGIVAWAHAGLSVER